MIVKKKQAALPVGPLEALTKFKSLNYAPEKQTMGQRSQRLQKALDTFECPNLSHKLVLATSLDNFA